MKMEREREAMMLRSLLALMWTQIVCFFSMPFLLVSDYRTISLKS